MDEFDLRMQLELHHSAAFGWTLSCCSHCREEAEDVLQTAYLKILDGRARYDGRASFKTWLFSVIRMTALDERRRHWLRRLRLEVFTRKQEEPEATGALEEEDGRLGRFKEALERLSRRQREVLHLAFYQELTLKEAAEVMGVGLGSARTHYERGKARLREILMFSEERP